MKVLGAFLSMVLSCSAWAEAVYPVQLPARTLGIDQRDVGSCMAEAEVGALELHFAHYGWPVGLSRFHRHAKNWMDLPPEQWDSSIGLQLTAEDRGILSSSGAILPDYMWPEDNLLVTKRAYLSLNRPSISSQAVIDPGFGAVDGFSMPHYVLFGDYRNTRSIADLKNVVRQRLPVTLSMQGDLFQGDPVTGESYFDSVTGLLKVPYESIRGKLASSPQSHRIMVVGFDDDLQAFIVRNSWNSQREIRDNLYKPLSPEKQADFQKMKAKIAPIPLPGFYALPYAYVNDLAAWQKGVFHVASMNYSAFFAKYLEFKPRYTTFALPFSCDRRLVIAFLDQYKRIKTTLASGSVNDTAYKAARKAIYKLLNQQTDLNERMFSMAKIAYNKNMPHVDRVREFYSKKFHSYYCGIGRESDFFPQPEDFGMLFTATSHPVWMDNAIDMHTQREFWDDVLTWMTRQRKF